MSKREWNSKSCPGNWEQLHNSGVEKFDGKGIRREEATGLCQASMAHAWGAHNIYRPNLDSFESGRCTYNQYVRKQDCSGETRPCGYPNIGHVRFAWLHEKKLKLVSGWKNRVLGLHSFSNMSSHSLIFSFLVFLKDKPRNQSCKRTWWDNNIYLIQLLLLRAASKNEQ